MRNLTLLLLTFALVSLSAAPAAQARGCANTFGGDAISAKVVSCAKAKKIVRTWAVRYRRDGRVNRRVLGYGCRDRSNSVEGLVVRCARGRKSVRFYANVPRR